jgi:hypothetical protein
VLDSFFEEVVLLLFLLCFLQAYGVFILWENITFCVLEKPRAIFFACKTLNSKFLNLKVHEPDQRN